MVAASAERVAAARSAHAESSGTPGSLDRRTIWRPASCGRFLSASSTKISPRARSPSPCPTLLLWGTDDTRDAAVAGASLQGAHRRRARRSIGCRTRIISRSTGPARTCARIEDSRAGWTRSAMPSFWPWMPIVAAAHTFLDLAAAARLPALFPAGRVRAPAVSPLGELRSLTDPAFWLSIGAAFLFRWAPPLAAGRVRGRRGDSRLRAARSPAIGQDRC